MKYQKKPIVVEAIQFNGQNQDEVISFTNGYATSTLPILATMRIRTMEGTMTAKKGDWIIKGIKGEFYPCAADVFERTYQMVI